MKIVQEVFMQRHMRCISTSREVLYLNIITTDVQQNAGKQNAAKCRARYKHSCPYAPDRRVP